MAQSFPLAERQEASSPLLHSVSVPPSLAPPCVPASSGYSSGTQPGSYRVRGGGIDTEAEAAVWREGGSVGSMLEAPLCKPGQPAALGGDRGPGHGALGGVPTGEISVTCAYYRFNFLGSPMGHGNRNLCGRGPGI